MKLYELTAHELGDMLKKGDITSYELTRSILYRVHTVENNIGSYITICEEEAMKRAELVQKKINAGLTRSPLAGIPVALKDNICTEGIRTTCASKMLHNFIPPYNATAASRLYEADTVLIGKTNMDEFSMGSSTENSFFKKTRNPWNTEHTPGGSSGGSAAAVASDETIFALGSDTGGSVRQPASFCGVVGLKPTYGAVSRFGLIAFASSLDQIGPITKDVTDCALVLNAIAGHDKKDSTCADIKHPDYTKALVKGIKGIRIGVPSEYIGQGVSARVRRAVLDSISVLKDLGAECEEFSLKMTQYAIPAYYILSSAEASSNLARYDGVKYGYRTKEYEDLYEMYVNTRSEGFGREVKRRIMLGTYVLSSGYYDAYYKKALKVRTLIYEEFEKAFEKYDVIAGPAAPSTSGKLGEKNGTPLDMYLGDIFTVPANITGFPALVLPCGFDRDNLPIGLQLVGKAFGESTLLKVGYNFEQSTGYHKRRASMERGEHQNEV